MKKVCKQRNLKEKLPQQDFNSLTQSYKVEIFYSLLAVIELGGYHLDTVLSDVAGSIGPDSMLAPVLKGHKIPTYVSKFTCDF